MWAKPNQTKFEGENIEQTNRPMILTFLLDGILFPMFGFLSFCLQIALWLRLSQENEGRVIGEVRGWSWWRRAGQNIQIFYHMHLPPTITIARCGTSSPRPTSTRSNEGWPLARSPQTMSPPWAWAGVYIFFYNLPFFKNGYILYVATFSPQHPQFCVIAEKLIRSTSVGTESVLGAPPSGPTGADNGITKTEFVNMVLQVISLSPSLLYSW